MCGQSTAYNTYATLSYTNPLFMGFSGYQNVNSSSQRDNIYNPKRLMAFQKIILHLGISVPGCFLVCELWYYYNIMKNIILDRCLYDNGKHKEW